VTQRYATAEEAEQAIQDGIVRAALILPNDLTQRMAQGRRFRYHDQRSDSWLTNDAADGF